MVNKNPLCRLEKPNTNDERLLNAVDRRWNKITQSLEILKKRVESLSSQKGVTITTSLQKKIPS